MKGKLAAGVITGVSFVLVILAALVLSSGRQTSLEAFDTGTLGSSMKVDLLVLATSIERLPDATRKGGTNPYPIYQISGLEILEQAEPRTTDASGVASVFPPVGDPQWVAGHALIGPIDPVPNLEGELLAGLSVWSTGFESDGLPDWHFGWIAHLVGDGDVTIYEGGENESDAELERLAGLMGRDDQAALLIDWVSEAMAERTGASPGPITLTYQDAFLPPEDSPEPLPSIQVPVVVLVGAGIERNVTSYLLVASEGTDRERAEPASRSMTEGSGPLTGLMLSEARMLIEFWDDGLPVAGTAIEPEDWQAIVSGEAGGVVISVDVSSNGTYQVTALVVDATAFGRALIEASE